jgi:acetyl-CoA acetyltransferase
MSRALTSDAVIAAAAESPYARHPPTYATTETYLADAVVRVLAAGEVGRDEVDGFGVSSFTLAPDNAIDLAWKLGLRLRWLLQDTNGGASGLNMLRHAVRAVEAGDAEVIVLVAGDRLLPREFVALVDGYNEATRDHLAPLPSAGPNSVFSFLTQRHMARFGLEREDYGRVAVAQRSWASRNPHAVYRSPLTLDDYLSAPPVAPPLHRFDCVPVVSGADAVLVTARDRVRGNPAVVVRAFGASYNDDQQEGDGLSTGLAALADELWREAALGPGDLDAAYLYDDYPVMVAVQATDLGLVPDGDIRRFLRVRVDEERWPLNTSGGQLSAGQAGAAGGMHGLVEAVRQLRSDADERQVANARTALVAGYGMVLYRYGACANAAILERVA